LVQRVRGAGGDASQLGLHLGPDRFDCVSMLPLYAGFLLRVEDCCGVILSLS